MRVLPEKDNPLCAAEKIDYVPDPPSFFKVEDWIDSVIMGLDVDPGVLYHRYPLTKSDNGAYEDEWRVWAPFGESDERYFDIPIVEGEVEAVFFGVNAEDKQVSQIIELAKAIGVQEFYHCRKAVKTYGLRYKKNITKTNKDRSCERSEPRPIRLLEPRKKNTW